MENVSKNVSELGSRLGLVRTNKGLSQSDLASSIGMSRPNYTAIENQIPGRFLKDYQLKILADKLDVSSDYLLGRINDPSPSADLLGIVSALQVSSDTIYKIKQIQKDSHLFYKTDIFENLMQNLNEDFWNVIGLYKKANAFYKTQYQFVKKFTDNIYPRIVNFDILNNKCDNIDYEYKYFYIDKSVVKDLKKKHNYIFSQDELSFGEKWDKLGELIEKGEFIEKYTFAYEDNLKRQEFADDLNKVEKLLNDSSYMFDFDESGLIFSFYDKQDEICNLIGQILQKLNSENKESLDNDIENLWADLDFFNRSVESALNFIKYKINDYLGKYLEEDFD